MKTAMAFLAGAATGWLARSAVDSSRGAVVTLATAAFDVVGWSRRVVATEREFLSDILAEARTRARIHQARSSRAHDGGARPEAGFQERGA